jgi:SnoaL-like domain
VTSDNLELVRRMREAFEAEPGSAAAGDRLVEVIRPLADPKLTARLGGGAISTEYLGIDGLRRGWEDFVRSFESVRIRFEDMVEVGDALVVDMVTVIGVPKGTELEIEQPAAAIFEFDRGRLIRVEYHLDREEALRRAGAMGG